MTSSTTRAAQTRVQAVLDAGGAAVFPGVYDTLSAKMAEHVGFQLAFISGYAVSATFIGEPDLGLLTQTEICRPRPTHLPMKRWLAWRPRKLRGRTRHSSKRRERSKNWWRSAAGLPSLRSRT